MPRNSAFSNIPQAYRHPEYTAASDRWGRIRDCIAGQETVKARGEKYLPMPNAADRSDDNRKRYAGYKERAVFVNVCDRTRRGLVGEVFAITPDVKIGDPRLELLRDNVDGGGTTLRALAKKAMGETTSVGRGGIFVDYPNTNGRFTTRAEQLAGKVRPYISFYPTEQIINWRLEVRDDVLRTVLVVLEEDFMSGDDGFQIWTAKQWRILRLNAAGEYTQEIIRQNMTPSGNANGAPVANPSAPTVVHQAEAPVLDASGKPFKEILFQFIGSEDNTPAVDGSPLYDIAELNISQYRNSADYEEAVFVTGQPTLWVSGLTQQWVDKNYKDKKVMFGSLAPLVLPENAQCGILQVKETTMAKEAMDMKSEQMAALGARLVHRAEVVRTATESFQDASADSSVLASCADNVSEALTWALQRAAQLVDTSLDLTQFSYTLSTDFALARMDAATRLQLMKEWQSGAITWTEYRTALKRANVAFVDDQDAEKEKETMLEQQQARELALKTAAKASADPTNPGGAKP